MNSFEMSDGNEYMKKLHELRMKEAERIEKEGLTIKEYLREINRIAEEFFNRRKVKV